ncbi:tetratricopeptide repeat protein [Oceaniserpentilla sp. 4NH20-0058]|uniref:tetratricopeptide repeat protein n=1 Tax=Oceaniserpentilla sp. 4NH20-0058 TaxID=3127660 RepID=UPI00310C6CDD
MRLILLFLIFINASVFASSISPGTYNALNELQEDIAGELTPKSIDSIREELDDLISSLKSNPLGLALSLQTLAQLETVLGNNKQAQIHLYKAIAIDDLEITTLNQLRAMLGYSLYSMDDHQSAIPILKDIIESSESPSANIYALLAASYYSIQDYRLGLPYIEQACKLSKQPKEGWLQMAFSGHYQLKNYEMASRYVDLLVFNHPEKRDYWQQKAGLHQLREEYNLAAITKELSYKKGFLQKNSDYTNLGQLLASQGEPYKVALIIEKNINSQEIKSDEKILNLLYQSWLQAKEINKAKEVLSILYDQYTVSKYGYTLLQLYVDDQDWEKVVKLSSGLLKLELTDDQKGKVFLYQGLANYRIGNSKKARISLGRASAFKSSSSQAKSWMSYIKQMET